MSLCLGLAAGMSSEGVRPAEALSTDSAIACRILFVFSQYLSTLIIGFVTPALSTESAVVRLAVHVIDQVHY